MNGEALAALITATLGGGAGLITALVVLFKWATDTKRETREAIREMQKTADRVESIDRQVNQVSPGEPTIRQAQAEGLAKLDEMSQTITVLQREFAEHAASTSLIQTRLGSAVQDMRIEIERHQIWHQRAAERDPNLRTRSTDQEVINGS